MSDQKSFLVQYGLNMKYSPYWTVQFNTRIMHSCFFIRNCIRAITRVNGSLGLP